MTKNTILLVSYLLGISFMGFSQNKLIYEENFDIPGEGIIGPQPISFQMPTGPWTLTGDFSGLTASSDYVMTMTENGEGFLEAQDTDAVICFESDPIDISSFDSAKVFTRISEISDLESSDFIDVKLWVDGSETFYLNYQNLGSDTHSLVGDKPDDEDFGTVDFEEFAQGNSLIIRICMKNNAGTEQMRIHQVLVEGFSSPDTTPQAPQNQLSFSLIDAVQNQAISSFDPIQNGSSIDLLALGTFLINFRYNASPQADKVKLGISRGGQSIEQIDDSFPYSLFGDRNGNYFFPSIDFLRLLRMTGPGPLDLYALEYKEGESFPFQKAAIRFNLSFASRQLKEAFVEESKGFDLFPNPSKGNCLVQLLPSLSGEDFELFIYNSQGKLIQFEQLEGRQKIKLDLGEIPQGLYFVKLQGKTDQYLKRLIIH
ncbi:MAG: T9SS type A sorting domain-containing protein [Bacteroidota bacterium]